MQQDSKIVGRLNIGFPFTGRKLNVNLGWHESKNDAVSCFEKQKKGK